MRKILYITVALAIAMAAQGQTKKIRGQVIQGKDSTALAFAKIELINYIGKGNWTIVDSTRSDIDGIYYFKADALQTAHYVIRVNESASFKANLNIAEEKGFINLPRFFYEKENALKNKKR